MKRVWRALVLTIVLTGAAEAAEQDALSTLEMKVGRLLPGAMPESFSVSPDGKRVAFFRTSPEGKKWWLVLDDTEGEQSDTIGKMNPLFSPDSRRVAYVAGNKGRKCVVVDGKAGKDYDAVGGVTFSPDSKHFAYMADEGDERFVVLDGVEQPQRFTGLHAAGPIFSPDGAHLGFAAKRGANWLVVIDGKEGPEYDGAGDLVFSPDNQHWAHLAKRGEKTLVVLDGKESAEYDGALLGTSLRFTTPYTVEAIVHRDLQILHLALSTLQK